MVDAVAPHVASDLFIRLSMQSAQSQVQSDSAEPSPRPSPGHGRVVGGGGGRGLQDSSDAASTSKSSLRRRDDHGGLRWESPAERAETKAREQVDAVPRPRCWPRGRALTHAANPEARRRCTPQRRRAAVWKWISGLGGCVFRGEGVSLTHVSLPVELFEPRSFLQRLPESWRCLELLRRAARSSDPAERVRCVATFALSGLARQARSLAKPFNPILGETLEAIYPGRPRGRARRVSGGGDAPELSDSASERGTGGDNDEVEDPPCAFHAEQVSHHPPVSAWRLRPDDGSFIFTGKAHYEARTRPNSVRARQLGVNRVEIPARDGTPASEITWELPELVLTGVLFGVTALRYRGVVRVADAISGLAVNVELDPPKPSRRACKADRDAWSGPDGCVGALVDGSTGQTVDELCPSSSWLGHIAWRCPSRGDGRGGPVTYWSLDMAMTGGGEAPAPIDNPLPSDSRFRADLIALVAGDADESNRAKVTLEHIQRTDRRWRGTAG